MEEYPLIKQSQKALDKKDIFFSLLIWFNCMRKIFNYNTSYPHDCFNHKLKTVFILIEKLCLKKLLMWCPKYLVCVALVTSLETCWQHLGWGVWGHIASSYQCGHSYQTCTECTSSQSDRLGTYVHHTADNDDNNSYFFLHA